MIPTILRLIATQQLNYTPLQYHSILVTPQQLDQPIIYLYTGIYLYM